MINSAAFTRASRADRVSAASAALVIGEIATLDRLQFVKLAATRKKNDPVFFGDLFCGATGRDLDRVAVVGADGGHLYTKARQDRTAYDIDMRGGFTDRAAANVGSGCRGWEFLIHVTVLSRWRWWLLFRLR